MAIWIWAAYRRGLVVVEIGAVGREVLGVEAGTEVVAGASAAVGRVPVAMPREAGFNGKYKAEVRDNPGRTAWYTHREEEQDVGFHEETVASINMGLFRPWVVIILLCTSRVRDPVQGCCSVSQSA